MEAEEVIRLLGLEPLGFEGGWYRETYRSEASRDGRSVATAIHYMHTPESLGLMHRLATDELYHFHLGDPVELILLHADGRIEEVVLGPDLAGGHVVQARVPAGAWQGSRLREGGGFGLMSTTMAPGFDLYDFELGDREELVSCYPKATAWIEALTPDVECTAHLELRAAQRDLLHAERRGVETLAAGIRATAGDWPPAEPEDALERAEQAARAGPSGRGWGRWYVIDRARRALVGAAQFEAEGKVGVYMLPGYEARGHEAREALMRWATRRGGRR